MLKSLYTLCPVGTASVSYRLFEALQMGVVPIIIYDERGLFLPYRGTKADLTNLGIPTFTFEESKQEISNLIQSLKSSNEALQQREKQNVMHLRREIAKLRETHFTPLGVADQIKRRITSPDDPSQTDLRCCVSDS